MSSEEKIRRPFSRSESVPDEQLKTRHQSRSRSPARNSNRSPIREGRSHSRSPRDHFSARGKARTFSRSISPIPRQEPRRERGRSLSPRRRRSYSRSPPRRRRSYSRSPPRRRRSYSRSPPRRRRSYSRSPPRRRERKRSRSHSPPRRSHRSRSPLDDRRSRYSRYDDPNSSKRKGNNQYKESSPIQTKNIPRNPNEASRQEQCDWTREMTAPSATYESVLALFDAQGHRFESRNLSTCAHRAAKYGGKHNIYLQKDDRMRRLADACRERVKEFDGRGLSIILWAFATAGVEVPALFHAIESEALLKMNTFEVVELTNTVWSFALARIDAPALFRLIAQVALPKIKNFGSQNLANFIWAYSMVKIDAPLLFEAIKDESLKKINEFGTQTIENLLCGFAHIHNIDITELFNACEKVILNKLSEFKLIQLCGILSSFATVRVQASNLFHQIAQSIQQNPKRIQGLNVKPLASLAYAFASMQISIPSLFKSIAQTAIEKLKDTVPQKFVNAPKSYTPQNLTSLAWAFAAIGMGQDANALFHTIGQVAQNNINQFSPQDLANLSWAFAACNIKAPELFQTIAQAAPTMLSDFSPQNLANIAWAFASMNIDAVILFHEIAQVSISKLDTGFKPQVFSNIAWAFASAGIDASIFFSKMADTALPMLADFTPQSLTSLAWAFATLGFDSSFHFFSAIANVTLTKLDDFLPPHLAKMCWTFACIAWSQFDFFNSLLVAAVAHQDKFDDTALAELHLVSIHFQVEFPDQVFPLAQMKERLQLAYQALQNADQSEKVQDNVATALIKMKWGSLNDFNKYFVQGIKLQFPKPDTKTAIIIDGPIYFLKGKENSHIENGPLRFKLRLLEKLGWTIGHIPYYEWESLGEDTAQQASYLQKKLQTLSPIASE